MISIVTQYPAEGQHMLKGTSRCHVLFIEARAIEKNAVNQVYESAFLLTFSESKVIKSYFSFLVMKNDVNNICHNLW